jgi:hypothetical protein
MTDEYQSPGAPRFALVANVAAMLHSQRLIWAEATCKLLRRPLPSITYGRRLEKFGCDRRFELHQGSLLAILVPMVVLSIFVDVLIVQGAIHILAHGRERLVLHGFLLATSLWMLAWSMALRSAVQHIDHLLGPHALTLAVGFRQVCRVPLSAIAEVRVIDRKAHNWLDACGLRKRDVTVLTPLDKPTLLIELKAGLGGAWLTTGGVARPLKQRIAVYVDQAETLRAAILSVVPSSAIPYR